MSRNSKTSMRVSNSLVEVKSKFDAEFRRFSIEKHKLEKLEDFRQILEELHLLQSISFVLTYTDPKDGYLLPITNDDNFKKAIEISKPTLKVIIQRKGESLQNFPNGSHKISSILSPFVPSNKNKLIISYPQDFRQVAAIIDVDVVPEVCRRVRLLKHGSDKPLGFYIRDGTSVRVTPNGLERVPGIYISRLVPGGLAESTGLLAVNDEVVEVNGIEVHGKTLDQVTDMMVANSSNLIITVKPATQRSATTSASAAATLSSERGSSRHSAASGLSSSGSRHSANSDEEHFDMDEIRDLTQAQETHQGNPHEGILHL